MARRPSKRARLSPSPSVAEAESHIFASGSRSVARAASALYPCSFEMTLNHDADVYRSLHLGATSDCAADWGWRLTEWTDSGGRRLRTDRFDAVHLLTSLPVRAQNQPTQRKNGDEGEDVGWSDLESDAEDVWFMSDADAAAFAHRRARAGLDAQHSARLAALCSPDDDASESEHKSEQGAESESGDEGEDEVGEDELELMRKTARVLAMSSDRGALEVEILSRHADDPRFAFLRPHPPSHLLNIWTQLTSQPQPPKPASALVAYDSDSDSNSSNHNPPPNTRIQHDAGADAEAEKRRKQAERLARAKVWLQSRTPS